MKVWVCRCNCFCMFICTYMCVCGLLEMLSALQARFLDQFKLHTRNRLSKNFLLFLLSVFLFTHCFACMYVCIYGRNIRKRVHRFNVDWLYFVCWHFPQSKWKTIKTAYERCHFCCWFACVYVYKCMYMCMYGMYICDWVPLRLAYLLECPLFWVLIGRQLGVSGVVRVELISFVYICVCVYLEQQVI